ncbi:MAG: glutamyl-tRNA reductase [Pseudomonadota bacterium]|jgi:glutamyl-tRNA reductase
MTLIALGLNHQTAPVSLRERVAFDRDTVPVALAALRRVDGVEEAAILSTCNRIELYSNVRDGREQAIVEWLHSHHGLTPPTLEEFLYRHDGPAAVRHLFRVATGLDSMVLGEPQILGQVKESYHLARAAGALGSPLERLFQNTFAVAKRVRTDTRIGANPVSVAFAAVRLAHQVFADLGRSTVMLVGAGDTVELAARHLTESGVKRMLVANRTLANAEALAARFGAQAMPLSDVPARLAEADVLIASTASREPVITRAQVASAIKARRRRPMLILDLAVPRDVEPATAELDDVFVYTVDDLSGVIEDNLRSRREAAREAEAIIDLQVGHFMDWCRGLDGQGVVRTVRAAAERERDALLARARAMLEHGKPAEEALAFLANALTNKIMHAPSANLRAAALRGDSELLRAAEKLFADTSDARPRPE